MVVDLYGKRESDWVEGVVDAGWSGDGVADEGSWVGEDDGCAARGGGCSIGDSRELGNCGSLG